MSEKEKPKLKPAEENPWYVLATICDKWDEDDGEKFIVNGKVLTNCEVWNARLNFFIDSNQKKALHDNDAPLFTVPKWDDIKGEIEARFRKRTNGCELPKVTDNIDFSNTKFSSKVDFNYFIFNRSVDFSASRFVMDAEFKYSFFCGIADFSEQLKFERKAKFHSAIFSDHAVFRKTKFCGDAIFGLAIFKFHSDFEGAIFKGECNLAKCEFRMSCDFFAAQFRTQYPLLANVNLFEISTFTTYKKHWPDPQNCEQNPEAAKATCEILREQMETQGLHDEAHFFFRRERHFAVKMLTPWQRLPNNLFACLSAYGFSLKRPLRALALLWALPMLIFWVNICTGKCANTIGAELWISLTKMAGLSIANIFQITELQRVYWPDVIECLPWGLKFLGGAQTLLAIPLLFLLLLGLRNRFRLK